MRTKKRNSLIFRAYKNQCLYFNENKQSHIEISDIPKHESQFQVNGHGCSMFEIQNDNKFAFVYGGNYGTATYNIYNLKKKEWDNNALKLNNQWFNNNDIMADGASKYGFGNGLSMVTDLFEKNKIHIIGGSLSNRKYGYFKFNHQIMNNPELSFVFSFCMRVCMCACVCFLFVLCAISRYKQKKKYKLKKKKKIQFFKNTKRKPSNYIWAIFAISIWM